MSASVDYQLPAPLEPESIRVLLRRYEAYVREVKARAAQLAGENSSTEELGRPVSLVFCVDANQLESAVDCGLIPNCASVEDLTDKLLRTFLDSEAQESQTTVTESDLPKWVESVLRTDMTVKSAKSRMKLLFVEYKSLLRANGLKWVTEKAPRAGIRHVLSSIRPVQLRTRLDQDLRFSHIDLKADFSGFMTHAIAVSQALEKIDNSPARSPKSDREGEKTKKDTIGSTRVGASSSKAGTKKDHKAGPGATRPPPSPCPLPKCKDKNKTHWIADSPDHTDDQTRQYREQPTALKARDRPSKSTRSPTAFKSVGRLQQSPNEDSSDDDKTPSCRMTVKDVGTTLDVVGRCDDGSDETVAFKELAEKAALKGIGKLEAIETVHLKVALTKNGETALFPFSRAWIEPSTVLHLSSGRLALKNIKFIVADDDGAMTCEGLLIGLPVLRHLRVDSETLLEGNIHALDGTDCSLPEQTPTDMGTLGRLQTARLNRQCNNATRPATHRPRVNYHKVRSEEDPVPDPSLLDPIDGDQHDDICKAVADIEKVAKQNGLADIYECNLNGILRDHMDIFRTSFSVGPPSKLPPLKIELMPDAKPIKVRLPKYSRGQKEFTRKFVDDLFAHGTAYSNPTTKWACAALLVPKPCALYRFSVDLQPVNFFTAKHQFPMPNLEHELSGLSGAVYFENFDMSHGYWQLRLSPLSQESQSFITPGGIFHDHARPARHD